MYRQSEKNLLSSNMSSTCPHNMVNFGPLTAEIDPVVWGTLANFSGFRVLAALRHSSIGCQPNFAALNRGRHLYSAGRPSRWALANILVNTVFVFQPHYYLYYKKVQTKTVQPLKLFSCRVKFSKFVCILLSTG